jgi:hypothetical protein
MPAPWIAKADLWRRFLESADAVIGPVVSEEITDQETGLDCTTMELEYPFVVELHAIGADVLIAQGVAALPDPAHVLAAGERQLWIVASAEMAVFRFKERTSAADGSELIATAYKKADA